MILSIKYETIKLVWVKVPRFSTLFNAGEDCLSPLIGASGVYASVFKSEHYSKTGIYFGATKNLYHRFMVHSHNTLAGLYTIPNKDDPGMDKDKRLYNPINKLSEFGDEQRLKRHVQELLNSQYYYALCDTKYMWGAERALIDYFRNNLCDTDYFTGNENFRGCKKCDYDIEIINDGEDFIETALTKKIFYKNIHRANK